MAHNCVNSIQTQPCGVWWPHLSHTHTHTHQMFILKTCATMFITNKQRPALGVIEISNEDWILVQSLQWMKNRTSPLQTSSSLSVHNKKCVWCVWHLEKRCDKLVKGMKGGAHLTLRGVKVSVNRRPMVRRAVTGANEFAKSLFRPSTEANMAVFSQCLALSYSPRTPMSPTSLPNNKSQKRMDYEDKLELLACLNNKGYLFELHLRVLERAWQHLQSPY